MKVKKIVIAIVIIFVILAISAVLYISLGGTIQNVPVLEWLGIKFSNHYEEYVSPVENQVLENEDVKVTLESTVGDYEFTILQFRVEISEDKMNSYKTESDIESGGTDIPLCYLSFNDPVIQDGKNQYTELNGANYNLIVDGQKIWARGNSAQSIEKVSENEYLVYQMWLLDQNSLDGKEEFEITLQDVAVGLEEECIAVEGEFKVEISKEKASKNTTTIEPSDATLKYKSMEKNIEKIHITPLQNVVEVKTIYKDVNQEDLTYALDEDYVGMVDYVAFDQDNHLISSYATEVKNKITYEDGTTEENIPGEFEFKREKFEHATYEKTEIITVEQNENIQEIKLKLYETLDYNETIRGIMEYQIDLNTNKVKGENRDVLIYDPNHSKITDEYKTYYKKFYNAEYDGQITQNELIENKNLISNVNYIEIEVLDETKDVYTKPLIVKDTKAIKELISMINDSKEYENFEEEVGAGDFRRKFTYFNNIFTRWKKEKNRSM